MSEGAKRIAAERLRQIEREGWTPEHDDEHDDGSLAWAAVCYAAPRKVYVPDPEANGFFFHDPWPESWCKQWDKRRHDGNVVLDNEKSGRASRIRQIEKAGALIAAEIDRLLRLKK